MFSSGGADMRRVFRVAGSDAHPRVSTEVVADACLIRDTKIWELLICTGCAQIELGFLRGASNIF